VDERASRKKVRLMRVLIDANVILDVLLDRQLFVAEAKEL
jgi:hypothetical protein